MLWETWGLGCLESHGCNIGYFSAHFKGVPATKNCGIIQINPARSCLGRGKIERRGSSLDAAAQKTRRSRTPKSTHSDLTCWDWPDPLQPNFHRIYAYVHLCIWWHDNRFEVNWPPEPTLVLRWIYHANFLLKGSGVKTKVIMVP